MSSLGKPDQKSSSCRCTLPPGGCCSKRAKSSTTCLRKRLSPASLYYSHSSGTRSKQTLLESFGLRASELEEVLLAERPAPLQLDEPLALPDLTEHFDAARILDACANSGERACAWSKITAASSSKTSFYRGN